MLLRSTKILALLAARLAMQGFAGHLIPFEAGFAPSSSPTLLTVTTNRTKFFDSLKGPLRFRSGPFQVFSVFNQANRASKDSTMASASSITTSIRLLPQTARRELFSQPSMVSGYQAPPAI